MDFVLKALFKVLITSYTFLWCEIKKKTTDRSENNLVLSGFRSDMLHVASACFLLSYLKLELTGSLGVESVLGEVLFLGMGRR